MSNRRYSRRFILQSGISSCATATGLMPTTGLAQTQDASVRSRTIAGWRQRLLSILERGRLPIIDMEATYIAGSTHVDQMIEWMNASNVAQIAFAPANAPNSQPSLDLFRQYPEYFIPCTNSAEFPRWWKDPVSFLGGVREDLKTGPYYLMGEHEFRHYPSPEQVKAGNTGRDISIPLDGPAGQALFQLSEDSGLTFQLHYEIEDPLLPALEAMLTKYPKARVIWCHLGMIRYPDRNTRYGSAYVRSLIGRFPGLYFDLAVPPPSSVYRPSGARDSTIYSNGTLTDDWRAVLDTFPERFVAASDYRPPVEHMYRETIERQRNLILTPLSEKARHLIAYANAWRLITGTPWSA